MIVKNEKDVIRRSLSSAKPLIDYWVIVDTGSTDGTQAIIKEFMQDIPGELHERPWVDFGFNRTEALELAKNKGDYLLFLDADDWIECPVDYAFPPLTKDWYNVPSGNKELTYLLPFVVKASQPWKWVGVYHENLFLGKACETELLTGIRIMRGSDGARSHDPDKFQKAITILKGGLKKEPNNERYVFYIAESYRDKGERAKALQWYQKRIPMGGWHEEVYWSLLMSGHLLRDLGFPLKCAIECYAMARRQSPYRVEPVYFMAECYNLMGDYESAYEFLKSKEVTAQSFSKGTIINYEEICDNGLHYQLGIAAYHVGHYAEAVEIYNTLLANQNLSPAWREITESNRALALGRLCEIQMSNSVKNKR